MYIDRGVCIFVRKAQYYYWTRMKLKMWLYLSCLKFFENVFWKQFIERHWLFIYNITMYTSRIPLNVCAAVQSRTLYAIRQWRVRGKSTWTGPITGRLPRCEKMLSHSRNIHKNIYVGIDVTQPLHTMCLRVSRGLSSSISFFS